jgi:hypothetical protein
VKHGFSVHFRQTYSERGIQGRKTADVLANGVLWEIKRPSGNNGMNTLKANIARANKGENEIVLLDATAQDSITFEEYSALVPELLATSFPEYLFAKEILVIDGNRLRSFKRK